MSLADIIKKAQKAKAAEAKRKAKAAEAKRKAQEAGIKNLDPPLAAQERYALRDAWEAVRKDPRIGRQVDYTVTQFGVVRQSVGVVVDVNLKTDAVTIWAGHDKELVVFSKEKCTYG